MVELQSGLQDIQASGATLIAVSYDEPEAVAAFAAGNNITYPLLSDPDSEIIRSFGILNTLIAEDDHPWYGIPFPGVYVIDANGLIVDKFFESHLALRPGTDQLVRALNGERSQPDIAHTQPSEVASVVCEVEFDHAPTAPGTLRELRVRLRMPEGLHVYGGVVPDGLVATSVEVDDVDGLIVLDTLAPPTRPLTLRGTGETLQVWDGDVVLRVPITYDGRSLASEPSAGSAELAITGRVRWQACDDEACGLPQACEFSFNLPTKGINRPSRRRASDNAAGGDDQGDGMDTAALLQAMVERRS